VNPFIRVARTPAFWRLWVGQVVSQFGDGFYWLAIMLGVSNLTGQSVQAVGLVSMAFLLPQLPMNLFGGPFIDRVNRRHLMIVADVLRVFTTLGMLFAYRWQVLPLIYVLALVQSSISGLFLPAKNALIPQIVSREDLLPANTLSQTTQVAALIFGPALAGFTIEHLGLEIAFVIDAATFLISALFLWWMPPVPTPATESVGWKRSWVALQEGVHFLWQNAVIRGVTVVVSVLFLGLGAVNVLWVPYMQRVFSLGAQEIGLVDAFQGLGMFLGTALLSVRGVRSRSPRVLLLGGLTVVSAGFVATGLAPSYPFILGTVLGIGLAVPAAQASFMTLIQSATPDRLMGRVNGAVSAIINGAMFLSMALATTLAEPVGLRESYVLCGVLGFLSVAWGIRLLPSEKQAGVSEGVTPRRLTVTHQDHP